MYMLWSKINAVTVFLNLVLTAWSMQPFLENLPKWQSSSMSSILNRLVVNVECRIVVSQSKGFGLRNIVCLTNFFCFLTIFWGLACRTDNIFKNLYYVSSYCKYMIWLKVRALVFTFNSINLVNIST